MFFLYWLILKLGSYLEINLGRVEHFHPLTQKKLSPLVEGRPTCNIIRKLYWLKLSPFKNINSLYKLTLKI